MVFVLLYILTSLSIYSCTKVDKLCLLMRCGLSVSRCLANSECFQYIKCLSQCDQLHDRCTVECTFLYGNNFASNNFLSCLEKNHCLRPDDENEKCQRPSNSLKINLEQLKGDWWVIHGLSPVYDHWDCQKMSFSQMMADFDFNGKNILVSENRTKLKYDYSMSVRGKTMDIPCTLEETSGSYYLASYVIQNSFSGTDQWFILDIVDDQYALIYYCGDNKLTKEEYVGAVVISKTLDPIPRQVLERFDSALVNSGLQLHISDFLTNSNQNCQ